MEAIRIFSRGNGADLKTAKEAIDQITESLAQDHPDLEAAKPAGCTSILVISLILLGTVGYLLNPLIRRYGDWLETSG